MLRFVPVPLPPLASHDLKLAPLPLPLSQSIVHSLGDNDLFRSGVPTYLANESPVWEAWVDLVGSDGLSSTWLFRIVECKSS